MITPHYLHRFFQGLLITGLLSISVWADAATSLKTIPLTINGQKYSVEVADNNKTRSQGLSGRTELASDHGMLFSFAQAGQVNFWMIDMHFPLDIIWLDSDQRVLGIVNDAEPCLGKDPCNLDGPLADPNTCHPGMGQTQCPLLVSPPGTQYVLELNGGSAKTLSLQKGSSVSF